MKFTIIITEDTQGNMFAAAPGLPDCQVQAATRDEVIRKIQGSILDIMNRSEILQLDIPVEGQSRKPIQQTPWDMFGAYRNDPAWGTFLDQVEQQRGGEQQVAFAAP